MNKKVLIIILIIGAVLFGTAFVPVFPDPFHKNGTVNFWVWAYRELYELVHGEQDGTDEGKEEE